MDKFALAKSASMTYTPSDDISQSAQTCFGQSRTRPNYITCCRTSPCLYAGIACKRAGWHARSPEAADTANRCAAGPQQPCWQVHVFVDGYLLIQTHSIGVRYLWFYTAEQHDEHDYEASPVFAVYTVHQHRVVILVHKHTQRLGDLLLALSHSHQVSQ